MTQSRANDSGHAADGKTARLARRDWILLPLVGVGTIVLILATTDLVARRLFPSVGNLGRDCLSSSPATGVRGVPNCVCWEQNPETPLVEYRFNSEGDRAGMERDPKAAGVYRIVLTGSSTPMGYGVARDRSLAALLPVELSQKTGRRIELYNESVVRNTPRTTTLHFDRILAAKPDMILWVLTPLDIKGELRPQHDPPLKGATGSQANGGPGLLARLWSELNSARGNGTIGDAVLNLWKERSTSVMTEHYLYESQSLYVKSFLRGSDEEAGFLKEETSPEWQARLQAFDTYAGELEAKAQAAGVPLVAVLLPLRAQAAMISMGEWPAGFDPYKLDEQVGHIITSHGGSYADILPEFRNVPNPEQYFLPVDGHPDADGQALISELLATKLSSGTLPGPNAAGGLQASVREPGR